MPSPRSAPPARRGGRAVCRLVNSWQKASGPAVAGQVIPRFPGNSRHAAGVANAPPRLRRPWGRFPWSWIATEWGGKIGFHPPPLRCFVVQRDRGWRLGAAPTWPPAEGGRGEEAATSAATYIGALLAVGSCSPVHAPRAQPPLSYPRRRTIYSPTSTFLKGGCVLPRLKSVENLRTSHGYAILLLKLFFKDTTSESVSDTPFPYP